MTEAKISLQENVDRPTARKYAFQGLVHATVMFAVGWISGRNGHPAVELVFYGLALIATVFCAYFSYRHFISFRASKKLKH